MRFTIAQLFIYCLALTTIVAGCGETKESREEKVNKDVSHGHRVYISDVNLLLAVRTALGTQAEYVTTTELATLTVLDAANKDRDWGDDTNLIKSLDGLEYATGLTRLDLAGNAVIDNRALAELKNLHTLDLSGNGIFDIWALAELKNLEILNLGAFVIVDEDGDHSIIGTNDILDIRALAELKNLRTLDLSGNELSGGIDPLAGLTNLEILNLSNSWIADGDLNDLTPLAGLTNLHTLDLSGNREISDTTPLAGLKNLHTLNLSGTLLSPVYIGLLVFRRLVSRRWRD